MRILAIIFIFTFCIAPSFSQTKTKYSKIKVELFDRDIKELAALGVETEHGIFAPQKYIMNVYSQAEIQKIKDAGFYYKVIIEDVEAFYNQYGTTDHRYISIESRGEDCNSGTIERSFDFETPENYSFGSMGGYLTYDEALAEMDKMHALYPEHITKRMAIGDLKTQEDRNIFYMVIAQDANNIDGSRPQVFYNSLHHAREPNSLSNLIFYMWYLLENYESDAEVKYILDNTTLFFLPILNPDGYVWNETTNPNGGGFWRKNRYVNPAGDTVGVDLNRNYGLAWGYDNQGSSPNQNSETYRGPAAFSEPETQAIRKLAIENNFSIALNYHTFGDLLIHPWGYLDTITDEDILFKSLGRVMTAENDFVIGTGTQTVGYTVNGESDDWLYGEQDEKNKIYSLTPEVGPSFWPPSSMIDELNKSSMRQNLNTAHLCHSFGWIKEIFPLPVISAIDGQLFFEFEKSGLIDAPISFSITSSTSGITLSGNEFNDQMMTGGDIKEITIDYTLDPGFPETEVDFELNIDNGNYKHTINLTKAVNLDLIVPDLVREISLEDIDANNFTGEWGLTESDFVTPPSSITESPDGNYNNNTSSEFILVKDLDLSTAEEAYLKFYTKFDIENDFDYVQLQVSTNGQDFIPVCGTLTNDASPDQLEDASPLYDGVQSQWVQESICLNDFIGNPSVEIKFVFHSDIFVQGDGFYIDDTIVELFGENVSSTDDVFAATLKVIPNPASHTLLLKMDRAYYTKGTSYEIYNSNGALILKGAIDKPEIRVNIHTLNTGTYIIKSVNDGRLISIQKFIKQ